MNKKLAAIAVAVGLMTTSAQADSPYSNMYVYGDSLTDTGTFGSKATSMDPTTGEYAEMSVERLAKALQINDFKNAFNLDMSTGAISFNGGTNYSVGGYNTSDILTSILGADIVDPAQSNPASAAMSMAVSGVAIDPNAVYFVSGGGNDFLQGLATDTASVTTSVTRLMTGASYLGSQGANYIVVPNLVALELAPGVKAQGPVFAATAGAGAEGFNQLLELQAASSDYNIIVTDIHGAMREFFADTQAYGMALDGDTLSSICYVGCGFNTGLEMLDGSGMPNPNANPDFFPFNDPIHPTAVGHALFGIQFSSLFAAPDVFGSMPSVALTDARDQAETVRSQMASLRYSDKGAGMILAAGQTDGDWGSDLHMGASKKSTSYTAGFHAPVGKTTRVAVALTSTSSDVDYGMGFSSDQYAGVDGSSIDSTNLGIVMSAVHTMGDMYVEVTPELVAGEMNTLRDIRIIGLQREQTASTDFVSAGVTLGAGYDFISSDSVAFGPMLDYSYRNVSVDAFSEDQHNSNALNVSKQRWSEQLISGGLFANVTSGAWKLDASARYVENRDDGREKVSMALQTISHNTFWLPSQARVESYTEAALSVAYNWCDTTVSANYRYQDADERGKTDAYSLAVNFAF